MSKLAAPGPSRWADAFGNLAGVATDPIRFFMDLTRKHGDFIQLRFPARSVFVLNHPDLVRQVLQENQQHYRKSHDYELMKPMLGEGLLTSDGSFWKRQRRLAQPAFHRQKIVAYAEMMVTRASTLADRWSAAPGATDVHADLMQLTLAVVGEALFGAELSADSRAVGPALDDVLHLFARRNRTLWSLVPLWMPLPSHRRFAANKAVLDGIVGRVIAARRGAPDSSRGDLLSMLMAARDEESPDGVDAGSSMTDAQLRDECMTMILAGHETTANLLSWTFVLLARNPRVADRLRDTIDAALRGAPPTLDDLPKLGEVDRVIKESLRLYPPAWAISRLAERADEMRGFPLPAGSQVLMSQYIVQRRPEFWPDPERFDPDRFLEAEEKKRPRFVYFPFGGGPRQCIGNLFATLEAQLLLTVLLQRTRVEIDPEREVLPEPSVTLRPLGGLPARVSKRDAPAASA